MLGVQAPNGHQVKGTNISLFFFFCLREWDRAGVCVCERRLLCPAHGRCPPVLEITCTPIVDFASFIPPLSPLRIRLLPFLFLPRRCFAAAAYDKNILLLLLNNPINLSAGRKLTSCLFH